MKFQDVLSLLYITLSTVKLVGKIGKLYLSEEITLYNTNKKAFRKCLQKFSARKLFHVRGELEYITKGKFFFKWDK